MQTFIIENSDHFQGELSPGLKGTPPIVQVYSPSGRQMNASEVDIVWAGNAIDLRFNKKGNYVVAVR